MKRVAKGDSATMRAATNVNAEQASKPTTRKPTRLMPGKAAIGREASDAGTDRFRRGSARYASSLGSGGGTHGRGRGAQHGKPRRRRGTRQPEAREGQAGPVGVAERPIVLRKPGNAGGGKGPWFESDVGRGTGHGDWGEPGSFKKCSETPDGVTRGCRVDDVRGRGGSTAPPSGQHAGAIDLQPRHRREQLAVGAEVAWTTAAHAAMSDTAAAVRHLVVAFIRWHSFESHRPGSCDIRRRCVPPAGVVSHPPASQRDPLRRRGQDGQDGRTGFEGKWRCIPAPPLPFPLPLPWEGVCYFGCGTRRR